jgi:hypothetical protein
MKKMLMFWIIKLEFQIICHFIKYGVTVLIFYFCGYWCIFLEYYYRKNSEFTD